MMLDRDELRRALRTLARAPVFAVTTIGSIAIGVGVCTLMFSVLVTLAGEHRATQLGDRVMMVLRATDRRCAPRCANDVFPADETAALGRESLSFETLAAVGTEDRTLRIGDASKKVTAAVVPSRFFAITSVRPFAGRLFGDGDDAEGGAASAILSYATWRRLFDADRSAIGRAIMLGSVSYTIVGIANPGRAFPPGTDLWVSRGANMGAPISRPPSLLVGVLRRGVTPAAARTELENILASVRAPRRDDLTPGVGVVPLSQRADVNLLVLMAAAILIPFLVLCANLHGVFVSRAIARRQEVEIRAALGAPPRRVYRHWVAEYALVGASAFGGAMLVFGWSQRIAQFAFGAEYPILYQLSASWSAAAFGASLTLAILLVVWHTTLRTARPRGQARVIRLDGSWGSRDQSGYARYGVAVVQIALAFCLSTVAGTLMKSFAFIASADTGFATDRLLTGHLDFAGTDLASSERATAALHRVLARLRAVPGVRQAVAWHDASPVSMTNYDEPTISIAGSSVYLNGHTCRGNGCQHPIISQDVTPGFIDAVGLKMTAGRDFTSYDGVGGEPVVVVNEEAARQWWPQASPLGQRIKIGGAASANPWMTVVGVVAAARPVQFIAVGLSVRGQRSYPLIMRPLAQTDVSHTDAPAWTRSLTLAIATPDGDPRRVRAAAQNAVRGELPGTPFAGFSSFREMLLADGGWLRRRTNASIAAAFGVFTVFLSLLGIYGVLSDRTARRTKEFGIRYALGAPRSSVLFIIGRSTSALVVAGLTSGTVAYAVLVSALGRFLYTDAGPSAILGSSSFDVTVMAYVGAILSVAAFVAAIQPARRAVAVDPLSALRAQ